MGASNINSVSLCPDGVTIVGEITNRLDYDVKLLHVWLAQPGVSGEAGVGLAIDFLEGTSTKYDGDKFIRTVPAAGDGHNGVAGTFFEGGPAIVSVIAVLYKNGKVDQVQQWSRIAMLSEEPDPVVYAISKAGQGAAT